MNSLSKKKGKIKKYKCYQFIDGCLINFKHFKMKAFAIGEKLNFSTKNVLLPKKDFFSTGPLRYSRGFHHSYFNLLPN